MRVDRGPVSRSVVDKCKQNNKVLYMIVIVLLCRYKDSDHPFGILDIRILITPLVS